MINAEKYKNELLKVINENEQDFIAFDDRDNSIKNCNAMLCKACKFSKNKTGVICTQTKLKWLLSEYKEPVKLTRLEYEILKWLEKGGYKFIVRSPSDNLIAYNSAPRKVFTGWVSENDFNELVFENKYKMLWSFNELFKFVKWEDEKPISIKEILKNCAVENIEEEQ